MEPSAAEAGEWFRTFFDERYEELHGADEDQTAAAEVRALWQWLDLEPGMRVLDAPCGTGRHSVELAARGLSVVGLDLAAARLERAQGRAAARGVHVEWVCGDLRQLPWEAEFDVVLNLFNSFGYFGRDGDRQALTGLVRALKPGGCLVLDLPNRDYYVNQVPPTYWEETASHWVLCAFHFDARTGVAETHYTFVAKGSGGIVEHRQARVRWYTLPELETWLDETGAAVEQVFGDWDAQPFAVDSPRLIIIARRGADGRAGGRARA